jgi:hypothetical protein
MPSPIPKTVAALFGVCLALLGCSKEAEAPPPPAAEVAPAPEAATAHPTPVAPAAAATVQQVNANWDAVSKQIANQDYDNAVRQAIQLNKAQQQAQLSEAARLEYQKRLYDAQEALRQKAQTDPKAREAYQALGRAVTGR